MAGTRRRKTKLVTRDRRVSTTDTKELRRPAKLPIELLEVIISRLTLKENIRASTVCKTWLKAAISVRVMNKPPWLMYISQGSDSVEFYDPSLCKSYWLKLPELYGCSRVCYAKDDWLLCCKIQTEGVFFFCPNTRKLIELPSLCMVFQIVAFSAAPISESCLVCAIKSVGTLVVKINTWRLGATEWTTVDYPSRVPFICNMRSSLVFSNGVFYCLSLTGDLGVYNPEKCTWVITLVPPPTHSEDLCINDWWKAKFMAEKDGDIYVIYNSDTTMSALIYKLNEINNMWVEVKSLGNLTLFAGSYSVARTDLIETMSDSIYFPKVQYCESPCISYSMNDRRYYPQEPRRDMRLQVCSERIWIEAPKDISIFV